MSEIIKESQFEGVNYYIILPAQVLHDNKLTPLARLIYGELSALANINGYAWISNQKLANKYEVSLRTINNSFIAVDGQNWIECTAWYGGGNGPEGGVIISNHDQRWTMCEQPYFYVYRLKDNKNQSNDINYPTTKENSKMIYAFAVENGTGTLLFDGQNTLAFTGKNAKAAYDHYVGTYKAIMGKDLPNQIKTEAQFALWAKLYPVKYIPFN